MLLKTEQLEKIYKLVTKRDKSIYSIYKHVETYNKKSPINDLLSILELQNTKENRLAIADKLATMRDESLLNVFKTENLSKEEIKIKQDLTFDYIVLFHEKQNKSLLNKITKLEIPKIYKILFEANYKIGKYMTSLHKVWKEHIIEYQNKELLNKFGTIEKTIEYLKENNLLDKNKSGEYSDHSYSGLIKTIEGYEVKTYFNLFPKEIKKVANEFSHSIRKLEKQQNIKGTPEEEKKEITLWIEYFEALKNALLTNKPEEALELWKEVDKKWMKIDSPIQMVHPIEYYDDQVRNAVSIEWDLRIDNPNNIKNLRKDNILKMFKDKLTTKNKTNQDLEQFVKNNIENVQLHIGKQVFYSGSQYEGLASAQVIPNDEEVSEKYGKKIFAFSEKAVELNRAKPRLLISEKIFGKEILEKNRDLLFNREQDFLQVYDITTIGHEYGHVLWKNKETEIKMNVNGNFKNIEEFKASAGGIISFFDTEEEKKLWEEVFLNTIQRAVSLIKWKNIEEVKPYYSEALITLDILFNSNVLSFEKEVLKIDISRNSYEKFKKEYSIIYEKLINLYLSEEEENKFLLNYIEDTGKEFLPKQQKIKDFVLYYFELEQKIGRKTI